MQRQVSLTYPPAAGVVNVGERTGDGHTGREEQRHTVRDCRTCVVLVASDVTVSILASDFTLHRTRRVTVKRTRFIGMQLCLFVSSLLERSCQSSQSHVLNNV